MYNVLLNDQTKNKTRAHSQAACANKQLVILCVRAMDFPLLEKVSVLLFC